MRVYLVGRSSPEGDEFEVDLSSFNYFRRGVAERLLEHGARLVLLAGAHHDFTEVIDLDDTGYSAFRMENAVIVADERYPRHVACALAKRINEGEPLCDVLRDGKNPSDALTQCQDGSAETLDVAYTTMDKLIQRGNRIDDLVAKTEELHQHALRFKTSAKKYHGSCCTIA